MTADELTLEVRPGVRVHVPAPPGWVVHSTQDVALLLTEPVEPGRFAANAVLTVDDVPPGTSLRDWQTAAEVALTAVLHDAVILDLEHVSIGGGPGVRRLLHHVTAAGDAVTAEQWATVVGDAGLTMTVSVPTLLWAAAEGVRARSVGSGFSVEAVSGAAAVRP